MTRNEGLISGAVTALSYLLAPAMSKPETVLFLIAIFGMTTAVTWSIEEALRRMRRRRYVSKRKRKVYDIQMYTPYEYCEKYVEVK